VWGSYKLGHTYASDKLIIYRSVSKKISLLTQKLSKIITNPNKYCIKDKEIQSSMQKVLEGFVRIETIFNGVIFKNYKAPQSTLHSLNGLDNLDSNRELSIHIEDTNRSNTLGINESPEKKNNNQNNQNVTMTDISINQTTEVINFDSYKSAQLSDFTRGLNIGNLIPLQCGHNGSYSSNEIDIYSLFLLNSKFII
jgi:hypothetical protein